MKIIFYLLIFLNMAMINSSVVQKNRNDIKSETADKVELKHSERVLNDVNEQLKRILAQRSQMFDTQRNLNLDPKKHLDLVLSAKDKIMDFTWKNGDLSMSSESTQRTPDGRLKVIVALENRYPERDVVKSQMQCTLHAMNHGIQYLRNKRIARYRVDYRSNCFRNTFTMYYIGTDMYKNPTGVEINLDFVTLKYRFKDLDTDFNFTYYLLPQYFARVQFTRTIPQTERDWSVSAHTRELQNHESSKGIKNTNNNRKNNQSNKRPKNTKGFKQRKETPNMRNLSQNQQERYRFKSSRYSFDIVSNTAGQAHFPYDVVRKIWDSPSTSKCSRTNLPADEINNLYNTQAIGMSCTL